MIINTGTPFIACLLDLKPLGGSNVKKTFLLTYFFLLVG